MTFDITFHGACGQVTGSLYVLRSDGHTILLECGMVQGGRKEEATNTGPFPVAIDEIDAVILSHAHIDHSGRIPLLTKRGYTGPIITQHASRALCQIMLPDSGYLNEKDAEWEQKKRRTNSNDAPVEPLYTKADAESCLDQFHGVNYDEWYNVVPGLDVRFRDAGHILGSAIVELRKTENGRTSRLVFSGDLGHRRAPVMNLPTMPGSADLVLLESTYGDRLHRPYEQTIDELAEVFRNANADGGNVLIPAFAVGRTQDLLYLMSTHRKKWGLDNWTVYLDSPMAIEATNTYARYRGLYDNELFEPGSNRPKVANFVATRTTEESMAINPLKSGAIIIAGSGMCSGGRIHHHLKNNIWRPECHVVIVGFQAHGTLGRRLVDGVDTIKLWGEKYPVRAAIHTIGGLSAHADQDGLCDWYGGFANRPAVALVHGEATPQSILAREIKKRYGVSAIIAKRGQTMSIGQTVAATGS